MKNFILTVVSLASFLSTSSALSSDVGIGAFLNRLVYPTDQTVEFYISGFNREVQEEKVDVHVGIIDGNGKIYEYPEWNTNLQPWLSTFTIPASFQLPVTLLGNLDNFPGGLKPGSYKLAVALTTPGTLDLVSFNTQSFKVISLKGTLTTGGISFAHGESASNITPPIASAAAGFWDVQPSEAEAIAESGQLAVDIEKCRFKKDPQVLDANLDAGATLSVSSPQTGEIILNKSNKSLSYGAFSPIPPVSFYQAGLLYTATGTGGTNIPAFSISAIAPKELIVTEPNISTLESIDSSKDFILRWLGNNGVGEIYINLQGGESDNSYSISCRAADDGELTIPSELLVQLRNIVDAAPSNIPDIPGLPDIDFSSLPDPGVNIVIGRDQFEFINNDDEDTTLFNLFWATGLFVQIE